MKEGIFLDIIMDIFTIITTLLNLGLCTYVAFKKENPTFSQKIALSKNDTIIISPTYSYSTKYEDDGDESDNYQFKILLLYRSIIVLIIVIFIAWFVYGWNTQDVSGMQLNIFPVLAKLFNTLFWTIFNTLKCIILSICILSSGLIYKNFKNKNSFYRIFHIISYSVLIVCVICNFVFLLMANYEWFIPDIDFTLLFENSSLNFWMSLAPAFLILEMGVIIVCIFKLSRACIFGQFKSSRHRINFNHITECIIAPAWFIIFSIYILLLIDQI